MNNRGNTLMNINKIPGTRMLGLWGKLIITFSHFDLQLYIGPLVSVWVSVVIWFV